MTGLYVTAGVVAAFLVLIWLVASKSEKAGGVVERVRQTDAAKKVEKAVGAIINGPRRVGTDLVARLRRKSGSR